MRIIDDILNTITMYRLVLYELIFLLAAAGVLGFFGIMPYTPAYLAFSTAFIVAVSWIVNKIFAFVFEAPTNPESTYITALILVLLIAPPGSLFDMSYLPLAAWAAALAMASKYILAWRKKHIFNPAALAVAVTAFALNQSASWWVGTPVLLPFVLAGGFLVTRKIQRFDLVIAYVVGAVVSIVGFDIAQGGNILTGLSQTLFYSPLFFFATVMLTEPLTTPPTRLLRIPYGALVGFLFSPALHLGDVYSTPELALIAGNIFSFLASPKQKLVLKLKARNRLSPDVFEFVFAPSRMPAFKPGQYMEWTLGHRWPDSRGTRRSFTLASSPSEPDVRLGVKFYPKGSSFKKKLLAMREGDTIVASQRAGDFTLPRNKKKKLAFIAGGIGITPFRSMIQYLLDKQEPRSVVLLYSNKTPADVVYQNLFKEAERRIGMKTVYAFSDKASAPIGVPGVVPRLDAQTIAREVPDYLERTFYLSGPRGMVVAFSDALAAMGVSERNIKKDFFPGFA
jgi:ferredoxin-NADP reductase